jgi:hypothetical protein
MTVVVEQHPSASLRALSGWGRHCGLERSQPLLSARRPHCSRAMRPSPLYQTGRTDGW